MRCFTVLMVSAIACGPSPRAGDDDDNGQPTSDAARPGESDACAQAAANRSYMACEFWAVDLDNAVEVLGVASPQLPCGQRYGQGAESTQRVCALGTAVAGLCDPPGDACPLGYACRDMPVCVLDAQHAPFAIVVSNPQPTPVVVTVTAASQMTITKTVAAGAVEAILPQDEGMVDQSLDGTGASKRAYKVTSTLPLVAYQFNPLNNVDVFSNDASLLVPRSGFDSDYYALTWPTLGRRTPGGLSAHDYHGYVTVVAAQDNTRIEVTPAANVVASATQPAIAAHATATFTLSAFETLNLEAEGPDGDLTGTRIRAADGAAAFGVFVGHEAAAFGEAAPPDTTNTRGPCCADHLEEMVFPTSTWGKSYTIARSEQRTNEADILRVVAQRDATVVMFDPPPASTLAGDCARLDAGEACTVRIMTDTAITASEPVLVGHYLQSAIWNGGGGPTTPPTTVGNGDPSMSIAVPVEQYRSDYTLLVPNAYEQSFLSISTGMTGTVTVDGAPIMLESAAGFRAARIPVMAGQHTVLCPDRCGVEVYGYSDAVSYMFAAGLDLRPIVL